MSTQKILGGMKKLKMWVGGYGFIEGMITLKTWG